MRRPSVPPAFALPAACLFACAAGCAVRPGYVDAATGRAYAGFAKPAFYCTDLCGLCGLTECDCKGDPYVPPVAAFTSFPGLSARYCKGNPPPVTTHVYAPPPARYEDFQGNPALHGPPPRPRPARPPRERAEPVAAPPPLPAPMPNALPDATAPPDATDDPFLAPAPPVSPEGIGQ